MFDMTGSSILLLVATAAAVATICYGSWFLRNEHRKEEAMKQFNKDKS